LDAKKISKYKKIIEQIHEKEADYDVYTPEQFKQKTASLKARFSGLDFKSVEDSKQIRLILDEIKTDAFALVKSAAKRLN
jgi:preprotein translocase subunit SecA